MLFFSTAVRAAAVALCVFGGAEATRPARKIPTQLRLAYAGSNGMTVSWNTYDKLDMPTVHYGLAENKLTEVATSHESVTYPTSTTYNNHVKITGLKPNTLYYYKPAYGLEVHTFRTSKAVTDHSPYEVAVVVDMGTMGELGLSTHVGNGAANPLKPGEKNTIQSLDLAKSGFDFLWHPGDIAYADYWLKEEIQKYIKPMSIKKGYTVYEKILKKFYMEMARITSQKPYMVGPGNHEANCDNGGTTDPNTNISYTVSICVPGQRNFTGYRNHFRMPSAESGGQGNFWYSFDHGMTHFITIDTETDLGHGFIAPDEPGGAEGEDAGPFGKTMNAQTNWLAADLAKVDRSKTPWVVVAGHRPWYVSIQNDTSDLCWICKDVFEPLFLKYNVDLVMSGHVHAYQRNQPVAHSKADPRGLNNPTAPWYITNGAGGHYDGLDTLLRPLDKFTAKAIDTVYGWSKLTFHNCTHLTHDFIESATGKSLDSSTLYKDRKCPPTYY